MLQEYAQLWDTAEFRDVREDICLRRAIELASSGEYREAITLFKEATSFSTLAVEDRQDVHLRLGTSYDELHEYDLAIQEYFSAIEFKLINDVEASARYRVARLHFMRGGFAQAKHQLETILHDYREALKSIPLKEIYEKLSDICRHLGEEKNAKRYAMMAENARGKNGMTGPR